jgi:dolichol-phosphate mannosyltransferase
MEYINKYDMIIGSRYVDGVNVVNWPMNRLLLSSFANFYARFVTRVPIHDLTGGFKCIKRKVLERINLDSIQSQGYSFQIEMNFLTFNYGFKIKEIPIIFHDRTVGESKMDRSIVYEAIFIVPRLILKKIFFKI